MNADDNFMSMKEMVKEIRADVKALTVKVDQIDRQGSIGTREELLDHERRLRDVESFKLRAKGALATLALLITALTGLILSHFKF